jgi:hypothetical protein
VGKRKVDASQATYISLVDVHVRVGDGVQPITGYSVSKDDVAIGVCSLSGGPVKLAVVKGAYCANPRSLLSRMDIATRLDSEPACTLGGWAIQGEGGSVDCVHCLVSVGQEDCVVVAVADRSLLHVAGVEV